MLAYRGYKDGVFVICGKDEPEFLTGVRDPILIDDQTQAESLAKKYGGDIKYAGTRTESLCDGFSRGRL